MVKKLFRRKTMKAKLIKLSIQVSVVLFLTMFYVFKQKFVTSNQEKRDANSSRRSNFVTTSSVTKNPTYDNPFKAVQPSFVGIGDDNSILCGDIIFYKDDTCEYAQRECPNPFGGGILNYLVLRYCQLRKLPSAVYIIFAFLFIIYLFYLLGDLADVDFCPSLEEISNFFKLSEDVAGVTFLAIGNGAPDIASIFVSVVTVGSSGLGIGEPLGSGMVITTLVFGSVCLFSDLKVPPYPFFRDVIFYMLAVGAVLYSVLTGNIIELWESILYLCLYAAYALLVIFGRKIQQLVKKLIDKQKAKNAGKEKKECDGSGNDDLDYDEKSRLLGSSASINAESTTNEPGQIAQDVATTSAEVLVKKKWETESFKELLVETHFDNDSSEGEETYKLEEIFKKKPTVLQYIFVKPILFFLEEIHWKERELLDKIFFVLNLPMNILRLITIPRSDPEQWSKLFAVLSTMFFVYFGAVCITLDPLVRIGGFPLMPFLLLFGFVLAILVFFTTRRLCPPVYNLVFVLIAFGMAIVWIYVVANELVNLLEAIGILFHLSESIIGITVLSWGNSIGDLFADTAMARKGQPKMAITAVFAGPSLNLLIGLGLAVTISCIKERRLSFEMGDNYDVMLIITFIIIFVSLASSLIIIPLTKFRVSKFHGVFLLLLYCAFMVIGVLMETNLVFPLVFATD